MATLSRDLTVKLLLHLPPGPVIDTLRLRLVNRAWCSAIDDVVTSFPLWRKLFVNLVAVASVADGRPLSAMAINGLERTLPDAAPVVITESTARDMRGAFRRAYAEAAQCCAFFTTIGTSLPRHNGQLQQIRAFERRWGIVIPEALVYFYSRFGIFEAVVHCYPTNNALVMPRRWKLLESFNSDHCLLKILDENQGCCFWYTVLHRNHYVADPPVYVSDMELQSPEDLREELQLSLEEAKNVLNTEFVRLESPHFSTFWALQAQDGKKWYKEHNMEYEEMYSKLATAQPPENVEEQQSSSDGDAPEGSVEDSDEDDSDEESDE